jgi:hypothetical protein
MPKLPAIADGIGGTVGDVQSKFTPTPFQNNRVPDMTHDLKAQGALAGALNDVSKTAMSLQETHDKSQLQQYETEVAELDRQYAGELAKAKGNDLVNIIDGKKTTATGTTQNPKDMIQARYEADLARLSGNLSLGTNAGGRVLANTHRQAATKFGGHIDAVRAKAQYDHQIALNKTTLTDAVDLATTDLSDDGLTAALRKAGETVVSEGTGDQHINGLDATQTAQLVQQRQALVYEAAVLQLLAQGQTGAANKRLKEGIADGTIEGSMKVKLTNALKAKSDAQRSTDIVDGLYAKYTKDGVTNKSAIVGELHKIGDALIRQDAIKVFRQRVSLDASITAGEAATAMVIVNRAWMAGQTPPQDAVDKVMAHPEFSKTYLSRQNSAVRGAPKTMSTENHIKEGGRVQSISGMKDFYTTLAKRNPPLFKAQTDTSDPSIKATLRSSLSVADYEAIQGLRADAHLTDLKRADVQKSIPTVSSVLQKVFGLKKDSGLLKRVEKEATLERDIDIFVREYVKRHNEVPDAKIIGKFLAPLLMEQEHDDERPIRRKEFEPGKVSAETEADVELEPDDGVTIRALGRLFSTSVPKLRLVVKELEDKDQQVTIRNIAENMGVSMRSLRRPGEVDVGEAQFDDIANISGQSPKFFRFMREMYNKQQLGGANVQNRLGMDAVGAMHILDAWNRLSPARQARAKQQFSGWEQDGGG